MVALFAGVVMAVFCFANPWVLLPAASLILYGSWNMQWYTQYRDHYYEQ